MTRTTSFKLPESVFAYLTQPAVRTGTDAVLGYGVKKLPPGLAWDELSKFYRASLAGSSIQTDWADALQDLWRSVWPTAVEGWTALSLDEQNVGDYQAQISIEKCCSEEWFGRCFVRASVALAGLKRRSRAEQVLCLSASIGLKGMAIGVSLDGAEDERGPQGSPFYYDIETDTWWTPEQKIVDPAVNLELLQQAATAALKWISGQSG